MPALRAYRKVFQNPALARLLIGEFISSIGDWLYVVALLVVVFQRSESPALLGVVGAVRVVPYILLSVPAGIIVDRFDRRLILMVTDVARGVVMLVMALLVAIEAPLVSIVAMALVAASLSTFFGPAIGAYIPTLARDESELGPANSAWASLDNLGLVIGPALGGILVAVGGLTAAFLINAATFAVVTVVLWRLPSRVSAIASAASAAEDAVAAATSERPPATQARFVEVMRTALGPLTGLTLVNAVGNFVFGGVGVLTVVIAVDVLKAGEGATGYLNAAVGLGGLLGAAGSAAIVVRRELTAPMIVGGLGMGLGLVVLGFSGALGLAFIALALAAAGALVVDVASTTLFQRSVPDAVRGRALGAMHTVAVSAYAAGSLLIPLASEVFGIGPVLTASALLGAIGVAAGAAIVRASSRPPAGLDAARATLLGVEALAGLPALRLEEAARRATVMSAAPGAVVIRQGDYADLFYVIVDGEYVVTQEPEAGGEPVELRRLARGDVFGEIGLLSGVPRTATVTSVRDGTLLALDADAFSELVAAGPSVGARLLEVHRPAVVPTT